MSLFRHTVQEARKAQRTFAALCKKHYNSGDHETAKAMDLAATAIADWIKAHSEPEQKTGVRPGD